MNGKRTIIISIIILVVIIAAILIFLGVQKPRPDPLSAQCEFFCNTSQKAGFCSFQVVVNNNLRTTCYNLSTDSQYSSYGVQPCPSISCTVSPQEAARLNNQTCTGIGGTWETPTSSGGCPQTGIERVRHLSPTDSPPVAGQICCG